MKTRERITAFVVVGAIIALAMLIHGLTSNDRADLEAASSEVGWTHARGFDDIARDRDRTR